MSPLRLTASKLGHAMRCAWPFRPDVQIPPDVPGTAALTGQAFASLRAHALDATHEVEIPPGADEPRARRLFHRWLRWWEEEMRDETREVLWDTEVPLALNLRTGAGRLLPKGKTHRDYTMVSVDEIAGTADLAARQHDTVFVLDDKTGNPEWVDPPESNWQLRVLALAAVRAAGPLAPIERAVVGLVFVGEEGVTASPRATLDAMDLDAIEADLRALVARIPSAEPTPGEHCRFCPARTVCPAFSAAAGAVAESAPAALAAVAQGNGALTAERIAAAWPQIRLLEAGLERIKDAVRAHVSEHGPVPLTSGKVLRLVESARTTVSSKSIRDALGPSEAGAVLAMLEARGAVTTSTSVSLREVKG